jgi:hypothetical protein
VIGSLRLPGDQVRARLRAGLPGTESRPGCRAPGAACLTGTPRRSGLSELVLPLRGGDGGDEFGVHFFLLGERAADAARHHSGSP